MSGVVEGAGLVLVALVAGAAVAAPRPGLRAAAMLAALVLAPALLVVHLWSEGVLAPVRDHPGLALVGGLGALAALGALALVIARRPALLVLLAAAALPFRLPVTAGGATSYLLVPLYAVLVAGALAYAVPRLRGRARDADDEAGAGGVAFQDARAPGPLEWLLAAAVVLYAAQALYSSDRDRALEQVVFFYVPFALLFALLSRMPWTARTVRGVVVVLAGVAALLVAVGFWEYATRQLLLNPRVIDDNAFTSYFRVNSLFFDPNMYGRFLVVVMLVLATAVLWTRRERVAVAGAVALAVLWLGLIVSFSQSSFTALLAGLLVLGALRWGVRRAALAAGTLAVAAVAVVLLAPGALRVDLGDERSLEASTSGRSALVRGGVELFAQRPVRGWGPGAFRREYRRQEKASDERATAASHTIPVTVAAEQGVVGLVAYLALLIAALVRLLRGAGSVAARAAVAAGFVALVVHTLLYAAFLEDPTAWALLAAGTALARET